MKVDINCQGNHECGYGSIELPTGEPGDLLYLWIGKEDKYFGTIESKKDLKKLKKMIDKVLKSLE